MHPTAAAFGAALLVASAGALAESYPVKPVTLVVPYGPGGPADTAARLVAELAAEPLGGRIVVENRPGAATKVAAMQVARAPKDGYTLFECTSSTMLTAALGTGSAFRVDDFTPLTLIALNPFVMSVTPGLPVASARELVDYAKAHPGELNLGSLGPASVEEIIGRWFLRMAGIEMVPVPYKTGLAAAIQDLMAGRIHVMFDAIGNSARYHSAGKLKILGVATAERVSLLPDVPTLTEQGYPVVNGSWLGLCAPAGTPAAIVDKLGKALTAAVRSEEYQRRIRALGAIPQASSTPDEFRQFIHTYVGQWGEMTRALGIQIE
ncbi:MAG TPA: tripartite tricarboxylate transporter substrate binding protein [Burkholderiales bacterium]